MSGFSLGFWPGLQRQGSVESVSYDDSWLPELSGGRIALFADFLTPFFANGENQGVDAVPIDSNPDLGVTFDSDHIVENFGYTTEISGEGWALTSAAFALIDPTDFCIIVQTNNGGDRSRQGIGSMNFMAGDYNPYQAGYFKPHRVEDIEGNNVATDRPVMSLHRYGLTFRVVNNVASMDGFLTTPLPGPLDMTGADIVAIADLPAPGDGFPVEYFAVISPSLTDAELAAWTGDLPAIIYGNAEISDIDFHAGVYIVDGVTISDIEEVLTWGATDPSVLINGQGLTGTDTSTEVVLHNEVVRSSFRDNFVILLDYEQTGGTANGLLFAMPQANSSMTLSIGNESVTDGLSGNIPFDAPGTGRHKIALRLVDTAATLFLDGASVGTATFKHEYQSPQDLQLSVSCSGGTVVLRRIYINAPPDDASMVILTTVD